MRKKAQCDVEEAKVCSKLSECGEGGWLLHKSDPMLNKIISIRPENASDCWDQMRAGGVRLSQGSQ